MTETIQRQISAKDISEGSITIPTREMFNRSTWGKTKGSLIYVVFPAKTAGSDTIVSVQHGLRKLPTYWKVVDQGVFAAVPGTVAPGLVYTDFPAPFTNLVAAFRCTVPKTWAKILLQ